MSDLIRIKRGLKADLPELMQGEMGFCTDTEELFIGGINGNININKREFDVTHYGAKGNGIADDTAAIQATINAVSSIGGGVVQFPNGNYNITSSIVISGGSPIIMRGVSPILSKISTTYNIPMVVYDTDQGDIYYTDITNLGFIGAVVGTRTNNAGILIKGTPTGLKYFNFNTFENLHFYGTYYGIRSTKFTNNLNGENMFNWNLFTQIKTSNEGFNDVMYGIKFDYGSGTGNIFESLNFVTQTSSIEWGGTGDENIGDITISDCQFGGGGLGIKAIRSGSRYASNISMTGCQWDAGISIGVDFTNMSGFTISGCRWGGATTHSLIGCNQYSIDAQGNMESKYGVSKTGIGIAETVDLFKFNFSKLYESMFIEIVTTGFMQGLGSRVVSSTYLLSMGGDGLADWVLINETAYGTAGETPPQQMSHVTTFGANPKIGVLTCGTSNDTSLSSQMRVIGSEYYVTVLN